jgi:protocatechuate 3,4-dioxygenase beta subunit
MRRNYLTIICIAVILTLLCPAIIISSEHIRCTGRVVDSQGQPIAGAKVAVYEMISDGIAGNILLHKVNETLTAEDGAFIFTAEPKPERGTFLDGYIIVAKPDLALGWAVWSMHENVETVIELGKPERLEGMIVDEAGKPIAGAEVRANLSRTIKTADGEEKRQWLPGISPLEELGTQTNQQGRFSFNHIPADLGVDLLITAPGKAVTYTYQSEISETAFKSSQTDIKVVLPDEARIEGKIVDPDTGKGIAGLKFAVVYTASGLFYYRFVCVTDDNGAFQIGGLLSSEYLIRGSELPHTLVNVKSGQTAKVTTQANKLYYGRILFEDGSPIVIKPEPWPGAEIRINLVEDERSRGQSIVYIINEEGYLKVYLSQEQYYKIKLRKAWFEIMIPDTYTSVDGRRVIRGETVFANDLLATDKSKAGVVKIPKLRREPDSLIGKSLPELKDLSIEPLPDTTDKIVLVCFFDMEQRPSRNCIMELNKRAKELQAKDIVIIAVQASKIKQSSLDEWIKEQGISFPVGMVEGDSEKVRFNWGVKSLPWLVLTDKNHIVTTEGFSVSDLDEKIK